MAGDTKRHFVVLAYLKRSGDQGEDETTLGKEEPMQNLEDLDFVTWTNLEFRRNLPSEIKNLGGKRLEQLSTEDLRQLITRGISLETILPRALQEIADNTLVQGDLYPGDLFEAMKTIPNSVWDKHLNWRMTWFRLLAQNSDTDGI